MKHAFDRLRVSIAALALGISLAVAGGTSANETPTAIVESFHAALLTVMKEASNLGLRGRYDRLDTPIQEAFNLRLTIRIATGSFWRKASAEQKNRLVDAFSRLSISNYASQFDGYSGQSFRTVETREGPQRTMLVQTQIVSPEGNPVGLTYVMKPGKEKEWRIIDILLDDDISQLAVRRSEYRRILDNHGIDGLINTINDKTRSLIPR
jgi:phospholipid transport system substrate-binding protein